LEYGKLDLRIGHIKEEKMLDINRKLLKQLDEEIA
jgi:hypothetical protein